MKLNRLHLALPAVTAGILCIAAPSSQAALITTTTNLPPNGVYLSTDVHAIYGGPALQFLLTLPMHAPLVNEVARFAGGGGFPGDNNDEVEIFGSTLTAMMDVTVNGSSITGGPQPIFASGPFGSVEVLTRDRLLSPDGTGTFDTEMLALNLGGVSPLGPFMIRESPTRASTGVTIITNIGGGQYRIDSFFDVFTELSIDGGQTWMPDTDSGLTGQRVNLGPIPEPGSVLMLGLGAVGLLARRSRRA